MTKFNLFIKSERYSLDLVVKPHKILTASYLILYLFEAGFPLFTAYVLKDFLNLMTADKIDLTAAAAYIAVYIASIVLLQATTLLKSIVFDSLHSKAEHKFDYDMAVKLNQLPMSFLDSSYGKDIISKAQHAKGTSAFFAEDIVRFVTYAVTFSIAFAQMVQFSLPFSLLFLLLTIPGVIVGEKCSEAMDVYTMTNAANNRKYSYYRWMLIDRWPAKDVRMYNLSDPIEKRYYTEMNTYRKAMIKLNTKKYVLTALTELLKWSGQIVFVAYAVISALNGNISVGDITLYLGFSATIIWYFAYMLNCVTSSFGSRLNRMDKLFDFLDTRNDEDREGTRTLEKFSSLEFVDVYFKYPHTDKYILSGASFTLERGDKLSIVGMNGSGKSTIVKLMLGLYEIDSGEILINGFPMSDYDIKDVRQMFSALFQSFVQYPLTLRDNIALSDYERVEHDEAIEDALNQSGVYGEIKDKLENGLDSYMTREFDDHGTELSRGQWQKIALSRAYFKNADILIMDEPSAALDAEAEDRIFKNFESISEGKTGIMISHRISAARLTNKIIVLDGGKITETGTHDELIAKDGLYARFYNLQKEKYTAEGAKQ